MNMGLIPQAPVNLGDTGTSAATTGQHTTAGSGFATVLVHIVGNQPPSEPSSAPVANQAIATALGMGQWEMSLADGEAGELLKLIGHLLESSDDDAAQLSPEDQLQFEAVLEELNALLVAMGMMAPVQAGAQGSLATAGLADAAESGSRPDTPVGDRLQAVLTAVAAKLDQGDQATRQWFRHAVEPQLAALKQLLVKNDGQSTQQAGAPARTLTEHEQPKLQPTSVVHAGSHLQRLSQLASPPMALISDHGTAAAEVEQPETSAKVASSESMPVAVVQDGSRWQPHQLKPLVAQPVPAQHFSDTVSGMIMKQFDVTTVNGVSEARISLFPEHLGQVDVKITIIGGQLTAMFMAENGMAKELLENGMNQLRTALQQQGLQVERLQVTQSDQAQQMFQEQRQSGSGEQHAHQQQKSPRAHAAEDSFEEELIQESVVQEFGYGNAINVTA